MFFKCSRIIMITISHTSLLLVQAPFFIIHHNIKEHNMFRLNIIYMSMYLHIFFFFYLTIAFYQNYIIIAIWSYVQRMNRKKGTFDIFIYTKHFRTVQVSVTEFRRVPWTTGNGVIFINPLVFFFSFLILFFHAFEIYANRVLYFIFAEENFPGKSDSRRGGRVLSTDTISHSVRITLYP